MFEALVPFVARGTLVRVLVAQIHRVLKYAVRRLDSLASEILFQGRVADRAVVSDDLSLWAEVLAVVTPEAALSGQMPNVIDV